VINLQTITPEGITAERAFHRFWLSQCNMNNSLENMFRVTPSGVICHDHITPEGVTLNIFETLKLIIIAFINAKVTHPFAEFFFLHDFG
jgi:hypothetical protein